MFAITWSSWHVTLLHRVLRCFNPGYLDLISGLAYTRINHYSLVNCWALFILWHICVVKLGFWSFIIWPWFVAFSIPLCYSNSGQALNFGNTVWVVSLDECSWLHGPLHPEAELLQALPVQMMLFKYLKAFIKPDDESGFCCCQSLTVSYNIAQCTPWGFLPNHPFFWKWLSFALFCSYRSRWSDIQ